MSTAKIALVTGGSRGLGRDMVLNFARKGLDILFTYHTNQSKADEVVAAVRQLGRHAEAFQLDTRDIGSFDAFVAKLTQYAGEARGNANIDFLVNNAGTALYAPITATTEEQVQESFDIHFKGVFMLTQKLLPFINNGGAIVNVSSGLTRIVHPGTAVYAAMKAAIETYTKYLAKELGSRKIRVNVIAPGAIETDFGGGRTRDVKEINNMIAGVTALGRVGLPEDIGKVVAFLCTEEAGWINAQRIEVSGGQAI